MTYGNTGGIWQKQLRTNTISRHVSDTLVIAPDLQKSMGYFCPNLLYNSEVGN